ncbi:hypothetical protein [Halovivax cerinus]|uniref:Uncharacterized protein n=1 Tax=Halovivax cerinus TaxID=1487865 RepID=A0ABD5NN02_9EURY|nr:hypothetical protein [Halovivax cerinus]
MTGRFALDIETVSPTLDPYERPPDFEDSSYFELLAVCLAYEVPDGEREVTVLFRDGTDPSSELSLVERTCDWIESRVERGNGPVLCLTYGGDGFDLPHLRGRVNAAIEADDDLTGDSDRPDGSYPAGDAGPTDDYGSTADRFDRLFDTSLTHVDLQPEVWDAFGEYTTLEDACEEIGIEIEGTDWASFDHGVDLDADRPTAIHGVATLTNRDVPVLGERYLDLAAVGATDTLTCRALREILDEYGREDVAHLFDLADARPFEAERTTVTHDRQAPDDSSD